MCPSPDYVLPPEEPPEPASALEALHYLRIYEPELSRALEEAALEQSTLCVQVKGYEQAGTRRLVMAFLRCAHIRRVPVLLAPVNPPNETGGGER